MSGDKVTPIRLGDRRPGEAFVLAKDNEPNYTGPDWCPFNLWQAACGGYGRQIKAAAKVLIESPGARELWEAIGEQHQRPDNIAVSLPTWCAEIRVHWAATPKMTRAEFIADRKDLKRMAERLARELDHFFDRWDELETRPEQNFEGGGVINFTQLLTEAEQERFGSLDYFTWELLIGDDRGNPGIVPNLPSMLRRIGMLFEEDAAFPPLERPNGANAERNYFSRRLIAYFKNTGHMSPAIVASIVSMFFPQGITENEVSQQVGRLPSGRLAPKRD